MIDTEKLKEIASEMEDMAVIVEGRNDKEALEMLGIKHIIVFNNHDTEGIIDLIGNKEVILLTDFDNEGMKIADNLKYIRHVPGDRVEASVS